MSQHTNGRALTQLTRAVQLTRAPRCSNVLDRRSRGRCSLGILEGQIAERRRQLRGDEKSGTTRVQEAAAALHRRPQMELARMLVMALLESSMEPIAPAHSNAISPNACPPTEPRPSSACWALLNHDLAVCIVGWLPGSPSPEVYVRFQRQGFAWHDGLAQPLGAPTAAPRGSAVLRDFAAAGGALGTWRQRRRPPPRRVSLGVSDSIRTVANRTPRTGRHSSALGPVQVAEKQGKEAANASADEEYPEGRE